jgi:hypothetical protein
MGGGRTSNVAITLHGLRLDYKHYLGLAVLAVSVAVLASFFPWARSGQTSRTSYELVGVAVRLEVLPDGAARVAPVWYALPALLGAAWLTAATGRQRAATTLTGIVALLSVVAAQLTRTSPLAAEAGASVALGSGALALGVMAIGGLMARSTQHER